MPSSAPIEAGNAASCMWSSEYFPSTHSGGQDVEVDLPPALAGEDPVERNKGILASLLLRRRGDRGVLLSPERFAPPMRADDPVDDSVDARRGAGRRVF